MMEIFVSVSLQKDEPSRAGVGMCILGFIMSYILPFIVSITHTIPFHRQEIPA